MNSTASFARSTCAGGGGELATLHRPRADVRNGCADLAELASTGTRLPVPQEWRLYNSRGACQPPRQARSCISTLSSQRPSLKPTSSRMPTWWKPRARCSPIDAACLGVSDHRDHLAESACGTGLDQGREQRAAGAAPVTVMGDIDRILDGEAISRPRPVWTGIGIAGECIVVFGDQVRITLAEEVSHAARHLGLVWWDEFE